MRTNFFIAAGVLPVELLAYQVAIVSAANTEIALFNIYLMLYWVE